MRTELKIGVTVVLVISVMVLVYFVFFANRPDQGKRPPEPIGIRAPEPSRAVPARSTPARPAPATPPAVSMVPRPAPLAVSTTRPADTIAEAGLHASRSPADSAVDVRATRATELAALSPATPRAGEPNRAGHVEPVGFTPTPVYAAAPPARVETVAPAPVDDRAYISPIRPSMIESNAVRPAAVVPSPVATPPGPAVSPLPVVLPVSPVAGTPPATATTTTGLIRKADGKDYYTVQKDDKGYWGIAAKSFVYGDGSKWDLIRKANPGADPQKLRPGQELVIPPLAGGATTRPATVTVALTPATRPAGSATYTVKANDSLASIAKAHYNNEALWEAIAKANPGVDPKRLKIGQDLVIPSADDARRLAGLPPTATAATMPATRPALARHSAPTPPAPVRAPARHTDFD
jgi:nucleoid-associated protein YgaU